MFRKGALMLVCACAAAVSSAGVIVTPGGAFLLPDEELDFTGVTVEATRAESFAIMNALGEIRATGTAISQVQREADGALRFVYAIINDATSIDAVNRFSVTNFAGWEVEAGQDLDNTFGPQKAKSVDRTSGGDTIGFAFTAEPVGLGTIAPGESSEVMWLRTRARDYRDGTLNVIDGGVDTVLSYAPVPEPATMATLAIGAVAMLRRRRK